MAKLVLITAGSVDFGFTVDDKMYNKFVDGMTKGGAVLPAYNMLSNAVEQEQHAKFVSTFSDGQNNPRATLVLEAVGMIAEEFTSDLPKLVKTPASSATSSKEMASSNS
jgi:hypothetical protein